MGVRGAAWIPDLPEETHVETIGETLLVFAPSFEGARRELLRFLLEDPDRKHGEPTANVPIAPAAKTPAPIVDLREAKREAAQVLPPGHPVREALLREPDELPCVEGRAKIETYLRLLFLRGTTA
jgi:hypothetical protein